MKKTTVLSVKMMTITAMFMALNIAMCAFWIPVPGGEFYLVDTIICTAAILLGPIPAFMVGGISSFLGDFFFFPPSMFLTLAVHGLQAVVVSVCTRHIFKNNRMKASIVGVAIGTVIMVVGYTVGKAYTYSTVEYAILSMPYDFLQSTVGAVASVFLCYKCGLVKIFDRMFAGK